MFGAVRKSCFIFFYQVGRKNKEDSQAVFAEKKGNRMLCSAMPRPAQTMVGEFTSKDRALVVQRADKMYWLEYILSTG